MIDSFKGEHRWLSNFAATVVCYDGDYYPTVEHAFQAAKAADSKQRKWVGDAPSAREAKRRGRQVGLRADWEQVKIGVMRQILFQKFSYNVDLRERLLNTGDQELVEGNDWDDRFWGVCDGEGLNHLGKLLMEVRGQLREKKDEG